MSHPFIPPLQTNTVPPSSSENDQVSEPSEDSTPALHELNKSHTPADLAHADAEWEALLGSQKGSDLLHQLAGEALAALDRGEVQPLFGQKLNSDPQELSAADEGHVCSKSDPKL